MKWLETITLGCAGRREKRVVTDPVAGGDSGVSPSWVDLINVMSLWEGLSR
jgi:hypothetical protein